MWYWNKDNFEGLLAVSESLGHEPSWSLFAKYCKLREQGLRKAALASIEEFITDASAWSDAERRRFVTWLYDTQIRLPRVHQLIVEPLRKKLVLPTLERWQRDDPSNAVALRLLGSATANCEYFEEALEIDPSDDYCRYRLVEILLREVEYQCHHLPDYFIGELPTATQDLATARELVAGFTENAIAESFAPAFDDLTNKINDWQSFLDSGQESFADWCVANNRQYNWYSVFYYDP